MSSPRPGRRHARLVVVAFEAGPGTWSLGAGQCLQVLLVALWPAMLAASLARADDERTDDERTDHERAGHEQAYREPAGKERERRERDGNERETGREARREGVEPR